jgi:hypothetical protein
MLLETAAKKPWKLAQLYIVLGGLNALGYALSGGDEDKERKLLPEEKRGRIFGIGPHKLVRLPWNSKEGAPAFLDVRRFIPVGDILDVEQGHGALPILPPLMPGGPLAVVAELMLNKQGFTGQEITRETDTPAEKAEKVLGYLYRAAAPNLPYYSFGVLPETYSAKAITEAAGGKTDIFGRERSLRQAIQSAFGVKEAYYPADVAKRGIKIRFDAENREIGENISRLQREYQMKGITREELEKKVAAQVAKRKKLADEVRERLAE